MGWVISLAEKLSILPPNTSNSNKLLTASWISGTRYKRDHCFSKAFLSCTLTLAYRTPYAFITPSSDPSLLSTKSWIVEQAAKKQLHERGWQAYTTQTAAFWINCWFLRFSRKGLILAVFQFIPALLMIFKTQWNLILTKFFLAIWSTPALLIGFKTRFQGSALEKKALYQNFISICQFDSIRCKGGSFDSMTDEVFS